MGTFLKSIGGKNSIIYRISFLLIAAALILTPFSIAMSEKSVDNTPTLETVTEKITTTEPPTTEPPTESTTEETKYVALSVETIQNDLRIKFYNKAMKLFVGYPFEITVTFPDGKVKVYNDENKDGKINLTNLPAGAYLVVLTVPEGYETAKRDISITVKDKIVYKPIENIKDDVVDESKVEEVKPQERQIDVPKALKDTVEYVESSREETITYEVVLFEDVVDPNAAPTGEGTGEPSSELQEAEAGTSSPSEEDTTGTETPSDTSSTPQKKRLVSKTGDELFIESGDEYTEAYEESYSADTKFYKKVVTISYKGFQTIDNSTYYFDKNGKAVTGEQIINGSKYTFSKDGVLQGVLGIDVSKWQGNIDWKQVADSGIKFAIIRIAGRGYGTSGSLYVDSMFEKNLKGAKEAGIDVGVYFFSQAVNEVEAVEEASLCIETLKGAKLKYPVFIDIEYATTQHTGRADSLSKAQRTAVAKAFCETIKSAGYKPGVYANKDFFTNKLDASALSKYCIWLAQYNDKVTYTGSYNMWQYTSKGQVAGINGNVDMDFSYISW